MGGFQSYDVFRSRYYKGATYCGDFEMPVITGTDEVPERVVRFSDSRSKKRDDLEAWVVSYEHDIKLERVWRNAFKYMDGLLEHPGIVSWDFSMYRVMPFALQYWNCFRGRLLGSLYERCGGKCIPNIRPSDSRSYEYVFDGLPTEATVSMGTAGNLRDPIDRKVFKSCVAETVRRLRPKNIVVYGDAPGDIFSPALDEGVSVVAFATKTSSEHRNRED